MAAVALSNWLPKKIYSGTMSVRQAAFLLAVSLRALDRALSAIPISGIAVYQALKFLFT